MVILLAQNSNTLHSHKNARFLLQFSLRMLHICTACLTEYSNESVLPPLIERKYLLLIPGFKAEEHNDEYCFLTVNS